MLLDMDRLREMAMRKFAPLMATMTVSTVLLAGCGQTPDHDVAVGGSGGSVQAPATDRVAPTTSGLGATTTSIVSTPTSAPTVPDGVAAADLLTEEVLLESGGRFVRPLQETDSVVVEIAKDAALKPLGPDGAPIPLPTGELSDVKLGVYGVSGDPGTEVVAWLLTFEGGKMIPSGDYVGEPLESRILVVVDAVSGIGIMAQEEAIPPK